MLKDTVTYTGALPPSACGTRRAESSSTPLPTCRRALPSQDRHRGEADSKTLAPPIHRSSPPSAPDACLLRLDRRWTSCTRAQTPRKSNQCHIAPAPKNGAELPSYLRRSAGCVVKAACSTASVAKAKGPSPQGWGAIGPPHTALPLPSRPVHETGVIAWELLAVPCAERRKFLTGALPGEVQ